MDRLRRKSRFPCIISASKVFLSQHPGCTRTRPPDLHKTVSQVPNPKKGQSQIDRTHWRYSIKFQKLTPPTTESIFTKCDRFVLGFLLRPPGRFHAGLHHRDGPQNLPASADQVRGARATSSRSPVDGPCPRKAHGLDQGRQRHPRNTTLTFPIVADKRPQRVLSSTTMIHLTEHPRRVRSVFSSHPNKKGSPDVLTYHE